MRAGRPRSQKPTTNFQNPVPVLTPIYEMTLLVCAGFSWRACFCPAACVSGLLQSRLTTATLYHMLTDDDPGTHPLVFPALPTLPSDIATFPTRALDRDPGRRHPMRVLQLVAHDASTAAQ